MKINLNLESLQQKLVIPNKNIRMESDRWCYYDMANCYLFAISLPYDTYKLEPGEISGMPAAHPYTDEQLVERLICDVKTLGLNIRTSSLEEMINEETSWKIAVMNCNPETNPERYDFHFLRQAYNQDWYQKFTEEQLITNMDERSYAIVDPATAKYVYDYHLVGYFVISKSKEPA